MEINGKLYCSRCMRLIETQEKACPFCGYSGHQERSLSILEEGTLLNERYQLGAMIGRGGFGITYAAWDEKLARPVAIKEYFPAAYVTRNIDLSDEVGYVEDAREAFLEGRLRFARESHLMAQLQEIPNVVKVLDSFEENETAYIVMEYIHGVPLDAWISFRNMKPGQILETLRPVTDALALLHKQGVVHRDLKPDNMLVEADGTIRLIDFGAAMLLEKSAETVILSRGYAPAEQYGKEYGRQGPWSDVYGLAAVLYRLLTGNVPDEAILRKKQDRLKSPIELGVRIGKKQNAVLMAALAVDPDKRIQSMEEFRARLYNLPLPEEVLWRRRIQRRVIGASAAVFAILLLLFVNFFVGFPLGQGLLYSLRSDGWHVLREYRSQQNCSVPANRLGIPVTAIGNGAFRNNQALVTVTLPESIYSIGDIAFERCASLQTVVLTENVSRIGVSAFVGTPMHLTIDGSYGSYAEEYAMKNGVRFTDSSTMAFEPTEDGLTLAEFDSMAETLVIPSYVDGVPVVKIKNGVQIKHAKTLVLPEQLRRIPDGLCEFNIILEAVKFGQNVEEIGERAFDNCISLNSLELPEQLRKIGASAFNFCFRLKEICWSENLTTIGESAFSGCNTLEKVELPKSVREIGERAFNDCDALRKIELPESMREIGEQAFSGCDQLATVIFSEGIESIPSHRFSNCNLLTDVRLPETLTKIGDYAFLKTGIKTLRLPNAMQSMGKSAFKESSLEYLYVPAQVSEVGSWCFSNCKNLKWLMFKTDSLAENKEDLFGIFLPNLFIGGRKGSYAEKLARDNDLPFENVDTWSTSVIMESNMAHLDYAEGDIVVPWYNREDNCLITGLDNAQKATSIRLSRFQTEIDDRAFDDCSDLTAVNSPGRITSIGTSAFYNCTALTQMPHFEGLIDIGAWAFCNCAAMKTLYLPEGLIYLRENAFEGCTSLTSALLPSSLRELGTFAFKDTGLRFAYIPGNIREISMNFSNCSSLETVLIGDGVKKLGLGAFDDGPKTIILPPSVQIISLYALNSNSEGTLQDLWIYNPDCASENEYDLSVEYMPLDDLDLFLPDNMVIHGYPGSTAEELAKNRGYAFQPIDIPYEELIAQYLAMYEE